MRDSSGTPMRHPTSRRRSPPELPGSGRGDPIGGRLLESVNLGSHQGNAEVIEKHRRPETPVKIGNSGLSVASEGFEPSKLARRIYSPLPLAARATRLFARNDC